MLLFLRFRVKIICISGTCAGCRSGWAARRGFPSRCREPAVTDGDGYCVVNGMDLARLGNKDGVTGLERIVKKCKKIAKKCKNICICQKKVVPL